MTRIVFGVMVVLLSGCLDTEQHARHERYQHVSCTSAMGQPVFSSDSAYDIYGGETGWTRGYSGPAWDFMVGRSARRVRVSSTAICVVG